MWRRLLSHPYRLLIALLLSLIAAALAPPKPIAAHPLGNFSVNRYTSLEIEPAGLRLRYVLDMAEIPTFQLRPDIDRDGDDAIDPAESDHFRRALLDQIAANLALRLDDRRLSLQLGQSTLDFPPGQGDLLTLRLEATFTAELPPAAGEWRVDYADGNYPDRPGWKEIVVLPTPGVSLLESTALTEDLSRGLLDYPEDLLQSPPALDAVSFRAAPLTGQLSAAAQTAAPAGDEVRLPADRFGSDELADRFAALAALPDPGPGVLALALVVAVVLGALHALSPGHGKAVVGAYLVGSRGTARHALFLGLTTTITHTAGVFAFGLLVLAAAQFIQPAQLYPWLGVMSGLMVAAIGLSLFRQRWSALRGRPHTHHHHHLPADHHHHPVHPAHPGETLPTDHHHHHPGDHADHHHHPVHPAHPCEKTPASVTWRSLLALGISGGILPCPSALLLLLSAIALGRVALGLVLIVAFSIGLAGVLTIVGLLLIFAGRVLERTPIRGGRLVSLIPLLSAVFVALAGALIAFNALLQTGLL